MAKATRVCKVCGKRYEYCHTWNNTDKFRWQDVACSPECGAIYFKRIEKSRRAANDANVKDEKEPVVISADTAERSLPEEFVPDKNFDNEEAVG